MVFDGMHMLHMVIWDLEHALVMECSGALYDPRSHEPAFAAVDDERGDDERVVDCCL